MLEVVGIAGTMEEIMSTKETMREAMEETGTMEETISKKEIMEITGTTTTAITNQGPVQPTMGGGREAQNNPEATMEVSMVEIMEDTIIVVVIMEGITLATLAMDNVSATESVLDH